MNYIDYLGLKASGRWIEPPSATVSIWVEDWFSFRGRADPWIDRWLFLLIFKVKFGGAATFSASVECRFECLTWTVSGSAAYTGTKDVLWGQIL
ncbi:hypothetical protein [Lampropedia aestuarii]|uniref:hypothetical protein n=1 Tax=Lampropedia aestuarii TaxID=2562762 RepID=UPI002469A5CE|nr:hypothetical protein [Lampropedia aestuarii]MDH5859282.1 hypothetical protein [Lampropedia aestuarii]